MPHPAFRHPRPAPAIIPMQEHAMPHGYFGDRDAGHRTPRPAAPAACGLFGRRGDDPPPLALNGLTAWRRAAAHSMRPDRDPADRPA